MSSIPDFSAMNDTERTAYFEQEQKKQKDLIEQSTKAKQTMSAMRVRPVFQQAIDGAKAPSKSSAAPTKVSPAPAFSGTSTSANNMLRLAHGENPFRPRQRYGQNGFIPDSQHLFYLLSVMDMKMTSTRKFVEGAEFWSPLISQYYMSVLVYLQIFRAMHEAGILSGEAADVYDLFCGHSPAISINALPVPGPFLNLLSQFAVHIPHLVDMDNICPMIPCNLTVTNAEAYRFNGTSSNMLGRLPNVAYLLDQIAVLRDALVADPADITVANQGRVLHRTVFGHATFASNAAPGNAATWNTRVPYSTTTGNAFKYLACDPASRHPFFINRGLLAQMTDYAAMINVTQPDGVADAAVTPSWTQFLGLDNMPFFMQVVRVMSWYSKYWQGSTDLSSYAPNGHTAGQTIFSVVNKPANFAAIHTDGRFYPVDLKMKGKSRNPLAPDSDSFDAATGPVNLSWTPADMFTGKAVLGSVTATTQLLATHRIGGPFFDESVVDITGEVNPTAAYPGILNQYYYSSVALKN